MDNSTAVNGLHKQLTRIETTLAVLESQQIRMTLAVEKNTQAITELKVQQAVGNEKISHGERATKSNTIDIKSNMVRLVEIGGLLAVLSKQLNWW